MQDGALSFNLKLSSYPLPFILGSKYSRVLMFKVQLKISDIQTIYLKFYTYEIITMK